MSLHYTYKLVNPVTGQFYFGSRKTEASDPYQDLGIKYKSSSNKIRAIGFEKFMFGVLETYDNHDECYWAEQRAIKLNFNNPLCLNFNYVDPDNNNQKFCANGRKLSKELMEKMRLGRIGLKRSAATKRKMTAWQLGRVPPREQLQKMWDASKEKYQCRPQ